MPLAMTGGVCKSAWMNRVGYYRLPPVRGVFFSPAQEERLLLLGEGRELIEPRHKPAPRPVSVAVTKPASPPVSQDDDLF